MKNTLFVFVADTHCGSSMGLMMPTGFALHDGSLILPSALQDELWATWEKGWDVVKSRRRGRDLIIVHAGDATEGVHHQTTQLVSSRPEEHEKIHMNCMEWAMNEVGFGKKDKLFYVSGTEEHTGNGSRSEETIAQKILGVVPASEHRATWDVIRKTVNGVMIDVSHHGGSIGNTPLTEENALRQKCKAVYFDSLNYNQIIPRYWIRAHNHRFVSSKYDGAQGSIEGILLPSFQMKTGYVYKRSNWRNVPSDVGLIWLEVDKDGESRWGHVIDRSYQIEVTEW